LLKLSEDL